MGQRIYLPGSQNYRWLRHALRLKRDAQGRTVFITKAENLILFEKWVECGRKARDIADFRRLCREEGVSLPAEINA